jgi:predicted AAA+ superfamily ATPase
LIRDVLARRDIRSPETFEMVSRYALDNIGNTFSARRVTSFLKSQSKAVGHQTVADYLAARTSAAALTWQPKKSMTPVITAW